MTEETENYNNNNDNNNENSEEKTISDLRDFGFSSRISEKASFYCENNLKKCLEWIYYHQRDKDFNDQLDTNHPDETKYYKNLKRFIRKGEPGEDYDEELYDHYDDNNSHHSNNNNNEYKDNNLETLTNTEVNNSNIHNEENSNTINNNNIGDSKIVSNNNIGDSNIISNYNILESKIVSNNNIGDSNIISDNNIGESKIVSNNNIGDSNIISNNNMNDNDNVNSNNNEKSIKDNLIDIYSDTSRITERINQQKTEKEKEEEKRKKDLDEVDDILKEVLDEDEENKKNKEEKKEKEEEKEEKNQYSKEENISFYIKTLKKFYGTAFYGDILLNCFETIKTILDNILNNPEDEKYKNIKLNNPHFEQKVGKYEIAVKLLKEIGFVQEEGRLTLKNFDRSLIEDTVNKINDEINNLK